MNPFWGAVFADHASIWPPRGYSSVLSLIIYFDEIEDRCEVKRIPVKQEMRKGKQQARCTFFNEKSMLNLNVSLKLPTLHTFEKSLRPKVSIL